MRGAGLGAGGLRDGDGERREKEKLERLAPAMEAALARRDPPRPAPTDYTIAAAMQI